MMYEDYDDFSLVGNGLRKGAGGAGGGSCTGAAGMLKTKSNKSTGKNGGNGYEDGCYTTKHVRVATQKIEAAKRKGKGTRTKRGGAK